MDFSSAISARARSVDVSGIRRIFELGAQLTDPINLSIGQPDFPVPDALKRAAIDAIENNRNGYTLTQGIPELRQRIGAHLKTDLGWDAPSDDVGVMVTGGTSGALFLAAMALLDEGDECIIPDPYFVLYPNLASLTGAKAVLCDTYPDFRMTAERVEPLITERTKFVLKVSPANPTGVVLNTKECRELHELCKSKGVLLIADEIYDEFAFDEMLEPTPQDPSRRATPSAARLPGASESMLIIRGFGKTYGCTGWRMGYAAGPNSVISQMSKVQQYSFVCAPSMAQWGCLPAFDCDMSDVLKKYERRRDIVLDKLTPVTEVPKPGGSFFAFVRIPEKLGMTDVEFSEACIEQNMLVIPGSAFSSKNTHFRISFAVDDAKLERGLDILAEMLAG